MTQAELVDELENAIQDCYHQALPPIFDALIQREWSFGM